MKTLKTLGFTLCMLLISVAAYATTTPIPQPVLETTTTNSVGWGGLIGILIQLIKNSIDLGGMTTTLGGLVAAWIVAAIHRNKTLDKWTYFLVKSASQKFGTTDNGKEIKYPWVLKGLLNKMGISKYFSLTYLLKPILNKLGLKEYESSIDKSCDMFIEGFVGVLKEERKNKENIEKV